MRFPNWKTNAEHETFGNKSAKFKGGRKWNYLFKCLNALIISDKYHLMFRGKCIVQVRVC